MKKLSIIFIYFALAFALDFAMTERVVAQDAASQGAAFQAQAAVPGVAVNIAPSPVVSVPAPAAPPQWASDLLMKVAQLPGVGPYLSKAILYLGILAAILTTLAAAALSIIGTLKGGFNLAGLDSASAAVQAFRDGKIMYWLTYFSNFNAKKPLA